MQKPIKQSFLKKALISTIKDYTIYMILLLTAVIASAVVYVWPSLILRQIIDGPLASGGEHLWNYAFLYLGAVLLTGISDLTREYGSMVFGQRMLLNIRSQMLDRLRLLPMSYYLETPAGETMSKFSADIDAVNTLFTSGIISAIADLLKIFGLLLTVFSLSPALGLIALGCLPIVFLLANYFRKAIYQMQLQVRKKVSDINTGIQEIYAGMKIIKIYGKERFFAERFEPLLEKHRLAMNANSIYDAWFPCIMQTLRASVIALALFIGAAANTTPLALGFSLGTLAAAADLFMRLFDPIEAVSTELQTIQQAMAGLSKIKAFFEQEIETVEKIEESMIPDIEHLEVKIENVEFSYQSGKNVLDGVSVLIPTGSKAAIAGRTGSGKTSLINLIAGLYPVKQGQISIGGLDPYRIPSSMRRRLIGIVPQTVVIFNGTIFDNVTLRDSSITKEQVEKAILTVGLKDTLLQLPDGINTMIGEGAQNLSFGQTQLLSLARAIVKDPPLLLLDELTSGLDAMTERQVLSAIRSISSQKTIITISHRISGIIDADMVHIMERGRIMESGSPEVLTKKEGWYARYKRLEDSNWRIS